MTRLDHTFFSVTGNNSGNGITIGNQPIYGYIEKIIVNSRTATNTGSFFLLASGGAISGGTIELLFTKTGYSGTSISSHYPRVSTVDSIGTTLSGTSAGYEKFCINNVPAITISGAGSAAISYFDIVWRTP